MAPKHILHHFGDLCSRINVEVLWISLLGCIYSPKLFFCFAKKSLQVIVSWKLCQWLVVTLGTLQSVVAAWWQCSNRLGSSSRMPPTPTCCQESSRNTSTLVVNGHRLQNKKGMSDKETKGDRKDTGRYKINANLKIYRLRKKIKYQCGSCVS